MLQKNRYKFVLQKYNFDCGVAATITILKNLGFKNVRYAKVAKELGVTREGVAPAEIVDYFRKFSNLKLKVKTGSDINDLKKELKAGSLCMIAYQSWGKPEEVKALECGHYSVAVGIDKGKVYLLDPTAYKDWGNGIGWRVMNLTDFKNKWVDKEYSGNIIKGWMLSVRPNVSGQH